MLAIVLAGLAVERVINAWSKVVIKRKKLENKLRRLGLDRQKTMEEEIRVLEAEVDRLKKKELKRANNVHGNREVDVNPIEQGVRKESPEQKKRSIGKTELDDIKKQWEQG